MTEAFDHWLHYLLQRCILVTPRSLKWNLNKQSLLVGSTMNKKIKSLDFGKIMRYEWAPIDYFEPVSTTALTHLANAKKTCYYDMRLFEFRDLVCVINCIYEKAHSKIGHNPHFEQTGISLDYHVTRLGRNPDTVNGTAQPCSRVQHSTLIRFVSTKLRNTCYQVKPPCDKIDT